MKNICPVCGREYDGYPALSRKDNKTEICPDCGLREALEDYVRYIKGMAKEIQTLDNGT